jgi:hypothetical protein
MSQLMDWAAAADVCKQTDLRLRCLIEVARQLTTKKPACTTFAMAGFLCAQQRHQHLLPELLGLVACSAAKGALPSVRGATDALEQAASSCTFEWSLSASKFLTLRTDDDEEMSPPFWAAGGEWRLILFCCEISEDMFGVFLCFFF